jgi:D-alanyl-D-alanine carboxypeptidase/D-alanyl-D-alanine-endopeptidase (penicillin-binding protein 4)
MAGQSFLFLLLSAIALLAQAQSTLPEGVQRALAAAKIPQASVAAVVQEVGVHHEVLRANAGAAMNPASVMKLVTAYAALEMLGPTYRWKTLVYLDGELSDGVLQGNLVLKGGGDPRLNLESFWTMLRALHDKGLREIRGDLVVDRSRFERVASKSSDFDGDGFRPYNVLPDALLVNFRSLRFTFMPVPETGAVRIAVEPRPPTLEVVNTLALGTGACPEGRVFRDLLQPTFEPDKQRAIFTGRYPVNCGDKDLYVALLEPNDQVGGVMRQLWSEIGGKWAGAVREGKAPVGASPFHVQESAPLAEIVHDELKLSNNVMARHIFLTLADEANDAPASTQSAAAAVRAWLAQKKIAAPELVLENGAGLSRIERISAATLAALLQDAWRSRVMPEFIASLPIAAFDGTMRRRLKDTGIAGQAHIKTGLLSDARAIAGYVLARSGRRIVVVMMVNHPNAQLAQPAMDALLSWAYEH